MGASMMFMATRILLLVSDNQAIVVQAFTVNAAMYDKVMHAREKLPFQNSLPDWNFYEHQSHLFHLALLNIECLLCVFFNVVAWRSLDVEKSELMSPRPLHDMLDLEDDGRGLFRRMPPESD